MWEPMYPKRVPERRPAGHEPSAPRWTARYEEPFVAITSDYLAVQVDPGESSPRGRFLELVAATHESGRPFSPDAWELLTTVDEGGKLNIIHLAYWNDPLRHAQWSLESPLMLWFAELDPTSMSFGAWHEVVQVPLERIETIYSDPRHEFGFARCNGVSLQPMTTNGYYGAARDRLPISAIDELLAAEPHRRRAPAPSVGRRLRAEVGHNTAVIRSGQYWRESEGEQLEDYDTELEPKLLRGMAHLADNKDETGTMSLRILRSVDGDDLAPRRETSTYAYFHCLGDLENWAEGHATHAAIYEHAIRKNRQYGMDRTVTTWHEVFILPRTASFEYVNCHPRAGVLEFATSVWEVVDG